MQGQLKPRFSLFGDCDYILSANQKKNEVAIYSGSLPH